MKISELSTPALLVLLEYVERQIVRVHVRIALGAAR